MHMRRFQAKGGYGEHGRSCFLIEYGQEGHSYMVDCGIMDSDSFPYPDVSEEELRKTDYLFLTHCHKDHSGAFSYFTERGFCGWVVTSSMTVKLENITYDKLICLPVGRTISQATIGEFNVTYGRSGHCPGGLWFRIEDSQKSCFFSGDYQADTLLYACDKAENIHAELAAVDCAHNQTDMCAQELREQLAGEINQLLQEKRSVILPVPHYGRGIEMLYMLKQEFKHARIKVDTGFVAYAEKMLAEEDWYYKEALGWLLDITPQLWKDAISTDKDNAGQEKYDVLLIADTHLKEEKNARFVSNAVEAGAAVIITGRIRAGSYPEQLWKEGKARRYIYPHHQSRGDFNAMIKDNQFGVVIPFHNEEKEIYF